MPRLSSSILILLLFFSVNTFSQINELDLALIKEKDFHNDEFADRKVKFLIPKSKNLLVRYNPVSLGFGSLLYVYQKLFSVQFSTKCAYEISCSNFSKRVISEFGLIKGVALTTDRLTRCTKLAALDIHPLDVDEQQQKIIDNPDKYRLHD